jgi:hypothetical protein
MGWSASISAPICRMTLLAVSINARCAGPEGRLPTLRSSWLASTLPATRQRSILIIGN